CNNIILTTGVTQPFANSSETPNSGLVTYKNMHRGAWGEDAVDISAEWDEVFMKYNNGTIAPVSNFHFKKEYQEYENQVGIYAGDGFSDEKSLAPIPRIISKKVAESTDESGKLQIVVKVKAK
ncbi:MAG: hypothetical protein IKX94_03495, partial [Muribaculaceae bacterium]|nr:hypothetical protein [Muribaculaceae bacterium]